MSFGVNPLDKERDVARFKWFDAGFMLCQRFEHFGIEAECRGFRFPLRRVAPLMEVLQIFERE